MIGLAIGILLVATVATTAGTIVLWRRTESASALVLGLVLYFWTFHGAWVFVADEMTGNDDGAYRYLFAKLVDVFVDERYIHSLILYCGFVCGVLLVARIVAVTPRRASVAPLYLSSLGLTVLGVVSLALSMLVIRDTLVEAAFSNQSGYGLASHGDEVVPGYHTHQLLFLFSLVPLTVAFIASMDGERGLFIRAVERRMVTVLPAAGLIVALAFGALLGNKGELLFVSLFGFQVFALNRREIPWARVTLLGAGALIGLGAVDVVRGAAIGDLLGARVQVSAMDSIEALAHSSEFFSAQMSMFAVLDARPEPTYGSSLYSLAASVVPRALWPDRPDGIYEYYADMIGTPENQGFTIHHATAWYLNFGVPGVLFGAIALGAMWGLLQRLQAQGQYGVSRWRAVVILSLPGVTAELAQCVRSGPEAYKSLVVYGVVFPAIAIGWGLFGARLFRLLMSGRTERESAGLLGRMEVSTSQNRDKA